MCLFLVLVLVSRLIARLSLSLPCLVAVPRTTKNKRTPRGTVDDAQRAEDEEWEVHKISARRQKGQVVQYLVHWKGCEDFNATWEPASNLAGATETVAQFEKE